MNYGERCSGGEIGIIVLYRRICSKSASRQGAIMAIGITHLGSGSRGNATVISSGECNVLVDCGFSLRQTEKRLRIAGFEPESIDSIVVTHHHKDHSGSALNASKKWSSVLHCNGGTASRMGLLELSLIHI